jgi:hypothetical protein
MPRYDAQCETHPEHEFEYFSSLADFAKPFTCDICGASAKRILKPKGTKWLGTPSFPFVSKHIDGKGTPIAVESLHHMRKLEKQHGVVLLKPNENSPKDLPRQRRDEQR